MVGIMIRYWVIFGAETKEERKCCFYAPSFFAASMLADQMLIFLHNELKLVYRVVSISEDKEAEL